MVRGDPHADAVDPCLQRRALAEVGQTAEDRDEYLLGLILEVRRRDTEVAHDAQNEGRMLLEYRRKSLALGRASRTSSHGARPAESE
jgi:hypothetical protein